MQRKMMIEACVLTLAASLLLGGCGKEEKASGTTQAQTVEVTKEASTEAASQEAQTDQEQPIETTAETDKEQPTETAAETETETNEPEETAAEQGDENMIEILCPTTYQIKRVQTSYGTLEKKTYYSTTCEKERPVNVVLPATYDPEKTYPVLYILHGIFGDQNSMMNYSTTGAHTVLGNMMADGSAKEMILVFPYMYASKTQDQCTGINEENTAAYDNFINDLRDDLMPYINANYSAATGRENTAVMGFSMGGRETLAIGLSLQDQVGSICAIAPAPGLVEGTDWAMHHKGQFLEEELVFTTQPILFMLCTGDSDKTVGTFPKSYHEIFTRNGQEHIWWEIPGSDHGDPAISSGIYNFGRRVFRGTEE